MEGADSILDAILDVSLEDGEDMEMMDIEDGEFVEGQSSLQTSQANETQDKTRPCGDDTQHVNKKKRRKNKKKKKKSNPGSKGMDVNRFVLDVCKRLRERKPYLVYNAIGVLGLSAISDLVKEVDAIQACGGQKTADGYRFRTGGGILWNILKVRDPNAYKEIMKKGKEFEKQFKQPKVVPQSSNVENSPERTENAVTSKGPVSASDNDVEVENPEKDQPLQPNTEEKRRSVHERIRIPVSYDDLIGEEYSIDQPS